MPTAKKEVLINQFNQWQQTMPGCRAYTRRGFNLQHQSLEEDGRYIYVGNFLDSDISILRVDGDQIVNTGKSLALPGHPASMRGRTR